MSIVIRSIITVFLFSAFIALWYWAWRKENTSRFESAARLPLEDTADVPQADEQPRTHSTTL
jgi:cbb3-type cytochrome oxidase subunit 3